MHHVDMLMCCLSALHTGLGEGTAIFCVCFKNSYGIKNNNSHSLSSVHIQDLLPLTEKDFFLSSEC